MTFSTRATIRHEVIERMTPAEHRELIEKCESAIDNGFQIDEETLEEYIGEILDGRGDAVDGDDKELG